MGPQSRGRSLLRLLAEVAPAYALAYALNGFFVYLGILHVLGVEPRSSLTGAYYGFLGVLLVAVTIAWRNELLDRIRTRSRPLRTWAGLAVAFAALFCANAALVASGFLPERLTAQLVLWSLPAALAAIAMPRRLLGHLIAGLTALGLLLAFIDLVVILEGAKPGRFTPIPFLDPISAGQICALGVVAAVAAQPRGRLLAGQLAAVAACGAGAIVTGSRGPTLALVVAAAAILVWRLSSAVQRPAAAVAGAALVAGLAVGFGAGVHLHSARNLTVGVSGGAQATSGHRQSGVTSAIVRDPATAPISTIHIRLELMREALGKIPGHLLVGGGVGMLPDETPEARAMGIAGCCTFPHNEIVESAYSLGLPGLALYVALLVTACIGIAQVVRRDGVGTAPLFALGFFLFAFVNSNVSGEIGADAWLWAAGGLAVGLAATVPALSRAR